MKRYVREDVEPFNWDSFLRDLFKDDLIGYTLRNDELLELRVKRELSRDEVSILQEKTKKKWMSEEEWEKTYGRKPLFF